jgi:hypothetical protein
VICQADGQTQLPDEYHPFLRPFIVYSNGTKEIPDDFTYGSPECEGFGTHGHTVASAENDGRDGFSGRSTTPGETTLPKGRRYRPSRRVEKRRSWSWGPSWMWIP